MVPFLALFVFRLFKENDIRIVGVSFALSALLFAAMLLTPVENKYLIMLLFLFALVFATCASAMLWSVYIPSQGERGYVSTINGVFDFTGYLAASGANMLFSFAMSSVGWNGIIVMWIGIMLIGVVAAVVQGIKK